VGYEVAIADAQTGAGQCSVKRMEEYAVEDQERVSLTSSNMDANDPEITRECDCVCVFTQRG
jgi:hypothetical protein